MTTPTCEVRWDYDAWHRMHTRVETLPDGLTRTQRISAAALEDMLADRPDWRDELAADARRRQDAYRARQRAMIEKQAARVTNSDAYTHAAYDFLVRQHGGDPWGHLHPDDVAWLERVCTAAELPAEAWR